MCCKSDLILGALSYGVLAHRPRLQEVGKDDGSRHEPSERTNRATSGSKAISYGYVCSVGPRHTRGDLKSGITASSSPTSNLFGLQVDRGSNGRLRLIGRIGDVAESFEGLVVPQNRWCEFRVRRGSTKRGASFSVLYVHTRQRHKLCPLDRISGSIVVPYSRRLSAPSWQPALLTPLKALFEALRGVSRMSPLKEPSWTALKDNA